MSSVAKRRKITHHEEVKHNAASVFTVPVLETIFRHLPSVDYRSVCARVCKSWKARVGYICTGEQILRACDFYLWVDTYCKHKEVDDIHGGDVALLEERQHAVLAEVIGLAHSGWKVEDVNDCVVTWAACNGRDDILERFFAYRGVNAACLGNLAIQRASEMGHLRAVRLLLQRAEVNAAANDNYCVRYASINGHTEVVRELAAHRRNNAPVVDLTSRQNWCMRAACRENCYDLAQFLLLQESVDIARYGSVFVNDAIQMLHWPVLALMLRDARLPKETRDDAVQRMCDMLADCQRHIEGNPLNFMM